MLLSSLQPAFGQDTPCGSGENTGRGPGVVHRFKLDFGISGLGGQSLPPSPASKGRVCKVSTVEPAVNSVQSMTQGLALEQLGLKGCPHLRHLHGPGPEHLHQPIERNHQLPRDPQQPGHLRGPGLFHQRWEGYHQLPFPHLHHQPGYQLEPGRLHELEVEGNQQLLLDSHQPRHRPEPGRLHQPGEEAQWKGLGSGSGQLDRCT